MKLQTEGPSFGIVGGLALDNVITADGEYHVGKPGGNTLWASLGAAMFDTSVGIVARMGVDYPEEVLVRLERSGVNVDGVQKTGQPHVLRIAYKHLTDGRRLQPVPVSELVALPAEVRAAFVDSTVGAEERRGADPTVADIPPAWLTSVKAWHIPLVPLAVHRALITELSTSSGVRVIADCPNRHEVVDLVADMLPSIGLLDVFLPSSSDIEIIDPSADAVVVARELARVGNGTVVLKLGDAGVMIFGAGAASEYIVPAVPVSSVDPTGAGDAFCGGFLVGLCERDDPLIAAVYGTVAASFAVESADPLALCEVSVVERDERMRYLLRRVGRN
jgi:sugar/nucleoside kinase (ribokinase family)